jgi:predicted lysophospholipase L1 biosynthesis ABC-type transport system permease subunit
VARGVERHLPVHVVSQSPDYLRALGIRPLIGRTLEIADASDASSPPALISATFAESLGGAQTIIGSSLSVGARTYQVVGVVPDMPCGSFHLAACGRLVTASPSRLNANGVGLWLTLRTSGDASGVIRPVQRVVSEHFPKAARLEVHTGRDLVAADLGDARTGAWFFSGFGLIALALGVGGVFGLVAYVVESRRREFGVRMALGAMSRDLIQRVVGAALGPVLLGAAIGLGAAAVLARAIRAIIVGVALIDPAAYGSSAIVMVLAAGVSALMAAWRLRRSSPSDALRQA